MRNDRKLLFFLLAASLYAPALLAAPFCVTSQTLKPECIYVDAAQCRKRAQEIGGLCVANPDELKIEKGARKYCMVTSGKTIRCLYSDRTSCDKDAARHGAVCMEALNPAIQQPLYQNDPNRKY